MEHPRADLLMHRKRHKEIQGISEIFYFVRGKAGEENKLTNETQRYNASIPGLGGSRAIPFKSNIGSLPSARSD